MAKKNNFDFSTAKKRDHKRAERRRQIPNNERISVPSPLRREKKNIFIPYFSVWESNKNVCGIRPIVN
jgi:hypothetical protein